MRAKVVGLLSAAILLNILFMVFRFNYINLNVAFIGENEGPTQNIKELMFGKPPTPNEFIATSSLVSDSSILKKQEVSLVTPDVIKKTTTSDEKALNSSINVVDPSLPPSSDYSVKEQKKMDKIEAKQKKKLEKERKKKEKLEAKKQKKEAKERQKLGPPSPNYRIALVLNDIEDIPAKTHMVQNMSQVINLGIIPGEKDSDKLLELYSDQDKYEIIMHMPMETLVKYHDRESFADKNKDYSNLLVASENKKQLFSKLDNAYKSMGGKKVVYGLSNHMGSLFTASDEHMKLVMKWVKKRKLYYLDNLSTDKSVSYEQAKELKAKAVFMELLLDDITHPDVIKRQLVKAADLAKQNGSIVVVGDFSKDYTVEVLYRSLDDIAKLGVRFVKLSELIEK